MSLRGYRIYSSPMLNGGPYKVLIESVNNNSYLFIQNSAITTLSKFFTHTTCHFQKHFKFILRCKRW